MVATCRIALTYDTAAEVPLSPTCDLACCISTSFNDLSVVQDAHGGLGPLIPGWQPPPPVAAASGVGPEWLEYSSAAASTVGEFDADEFSMGGGTSEVSGVQRLPDFKSMLEAALRGDVVRHNLLSAS